MRLKNKGQFLYDLAAFKVTNRRKDAQTHEVWDQSIGFRLFSFISKKMWGFQDKTTDYWGFHLKPPNRPLNVRIPVRIRMSSV